MSELDAAIANVFEQAMVYGAKSTLGFFTVMVTLAAGSGTDNPLMTCVGAEAVKENGTDTLEPVLLQYSTAAT